jgi:hypothetical protein
VVILIENHRYLIIKQFIMISNLKFNLLLLLFVPNSYGQKYSPTLYSNGQENKITFEKGFLKVNFGVDLFLREDRFELLMMAFEGEKFLEEQDESYVKENFEVLIKKYKEQVKSFKAIDYGFDNSFYIGYRIVDGKYKFFALHKFVNVDLGFGKIPCLAMKNSEFQINRKNFFVMIIINGTIKSFYQIQPDTKGNPVFKKEVKEEMILVL